jgi:hypothetical protein
MQSAYFSFVLPTWIVNGRSPAEALIEWRKRIEDPTSFRVELLPRLLEWGMASGDRALLQRIRSQTEVKMQDVEGCLRLLNGDFDEAFQLLAATLSNRADKKLLTKLGGLPSVLAMLSAIAGHASGSREQAFKATMTALKPGASPYADALAVAQRGLLFTAAPHDPKKLISDLNATSGSPLAKWMAGYVQAWLVLDADEKNEVSGLADAATAFRTSGCFWLAAEVHCAAGRSTLKTAQKQKELGERLHHEHGSVSLIDFVQPEPVWARTLDAIAMLGGLRKPTAKVDEGAAPTDRLIFEIFHNSNDFQLEVFHQVRKGSQWSAGRKVALARLYAQHAQPEFSFLTPEDHALCQTLRHWTERGTYGYPEEYTQFEAISGARALIGHPRIVRPKSREPVEIIEKLVS